MWANVCERINSCPGEGLESHSSSPSSLTPHTLSCQTRGTWSGIFQGSSKGHLLFSLASFLPWWGWLSPPLSSHSLTSDLLTDPLPKPRGRLAAVHLGPGP